jgi:transposase
MGGEGVRGDFEPGSVERLETGRRRVVAVQEWAEIRAMRAVQGLSIKEIARRTGHSRNTIRAALRSAQPPRYGPRAPRPSKLDPFKAKIHELLGDDAAIPRR